MRRKTFVIECFGKYSNKTFVIACFGKYLKTLEYEIHLLIFLKTLIICAFTQRKKQFKFQVRWRLFFWLNAEYNFF